MLASRLIWCGLKALEACDFDGSFHHADYTRVTLISHPQYAWDGSWLAQPSAEKINCH
jgi:hypothetical protein